MNHRVLGIGFVVVVMFLTREDWMVKPWTDDRIREALAQECRLSAGSELTDKYDLGSISNTRFSFDDDAVKKVSFDSDAATYDVSGEGQPTHFISSETSTDPDVLDVRFQCVGNYKLNTYGDLNQIELNGKVILNES